VTDDGTALDLQMVQKLRNCLSVIFQCIAKCLRPVAESKSEQIDQDGAMTEQARVDDHLREIR